MSGNTDIFKVAICDSINYQDRGLIAQYPPSILCLVAALRRLVFMPEESNSLIQIITFP